MKRYLQYEIKQAILLLCSTKRKKKKLTMAIETYFCYGITGSIKLKQEEKTKTLKMMFCYKKNVKLDLITSLEKTKRR